ncbi:hypothetical protein SH1V18_47760 [Vallitalea longa]|uniref:Uncharacterized protein n=1 Tax=Vallitalea longa TaxID=2936439 RepID=A0A9W6DGH1_9FIRM|nr:hypothetical protein [Vallitalea longa]GKX32296.1 hypothetical protein SH1V18_47760 [Vallitalea longa]
MKSLRDIQYNYKLYDNGVVQSITYNLDKISELKELFSKINLNDNFDSNDFITDMMKLCWFGQTSSIVLSLTGETKNEKRYKVKDILIDYQIGKDFFDLNLILENSGKQVYEIDFKNIVIEKINKNNYTNEIIGFYKYYIECDMTAYEIKSNEKEKVKSENKREDLYRIIFDIKGK